MVRLDLGAFASIIDIHITTCKKNVNFATLFNNKKGSLSGKFVGHYFAVEG
ncbi:MAG: hypothetical protein BroJett020_09780 [Bacteroidota bacterium]|nr:hypothetical protein [Flavobacteriales bacterium]GIK69683.1 MAG: hypothetical protein BroJett020_09780 [Bacteroidota bacterium]